MEQAKAAVAAEHQQLSSKLRSREAELTSCQTRVATLEQELASMEVGDGQQFDGMKRRLEVTCFLLYAFCGTTNESKSFKDLRVV